MPPRDVPEAAFSIDSLPVVVYTGSGNGDAP